MRIYLVVNVGQVIRYSKQVEGQKVEEVQLVEIDGVKKQEVEKILDKENKRSCEVFGTLEKIYSKK